MSDGTAGAVAIQSASNSQIPETGVAIKLCIALESVAAIIVSENIAQRNYPKKETVQVQGKQGTQRKQNRRSNQDGQNEGSGKGKEQGQGSGGSEQGKQSKQTGPPDFWLSIRNKKPKELRQFESFGLKIIEEIGIDNECFNYEELTVMLEQFEQELRAEDSRQKAGQKLKTSPLYAKAKQSCQGDASTKARADLRAAVVNYLLINQNILSLNKLAGEAERVRLFTDDICKCLKAIADFRNNSGHRDDKKSMTDFLSNVKRADEFFSEQLQRWAEYDEVIKEKLRVRDLLKEYEEIIRLPRQYKAQKTINLEFSEIFRKLGEDMRRQTESVGNTSVQEEASLHACGRFLTHPVTASDSGVYSLLEKTENRDPSDGEVLPVPSEYVPPNRTYASLDGVAELELRDYQIELSQKSRSGKNDIILLPTGTGKTYIAIQVIVEHLDRLGETGKPKVLFLAPLSDLAKQQLQKIKNYLPPLWQGKARTIIGEDSTRPDEMRELMVGVEYAVLVVTPAMVVNYFSWYKDASIKDFTLLIFDEFHHAKKDHPYNKLITKCVREKLASDGREDGSPSRSFPQMLGLTATIGIGDSTDVLSAKKFILQMCAKFGLREPPSESQQQREIDKTRVNEKYIELEKQRDDGMSSYLQDRLMMPLEADIKRKLNSPPFQKREENISAEFPSDRHGQIYESYLVGLRDRVIRLLSYPELQQDAQYCKIALDYLLEYFRAMHLVNLLNCDHGINHLGMELFSKPVYQSIDSIWQMYLENLSELTHLAEVEDRDHPNQKVQCLKSKLSQLFAEKPDSKVIIFVQMREVAQCLKDMLNSNDKFKAKEFISTGPSADDKGMMPRERADAREGFEGQKYNILVATSVLEEGIDIQACNMVIRYMYVKDMIAKIQSRGRARHKEGVMIAMLDGKLMEQEQRNNTKEVLMYKALDAVRGMPPQEFQKEVELYAKELIPPDLPPVTRQPVLQTAAEITCRSCGRYLGDMASVRRYCESRFLIFDGQLCERVNAQRRKAPLMAVLDDLTPAAGLFCQGIDNRVCKNKVGNLFKMSSGVYLGSWIIKEILVIGSPVKKYKDVSKHGIEIRPIDARELYDLARDISYPASLLF